MSLRSTTRRCPHCGTRLHQRHQGSCPGCGGDTESVPAGAANLSEVQGPVPVKVLLRDLLIFELKLLMDGLGDVLLSQLAVIAIALDLVTGGSRRGRLFYGVLRAGERWDRWLNLYEPARDARETSDGLFGASQRGANTFLGKLEEIARDRDLDAIRPRKPKDPKGKGQ